MSSDRIPKQEVVGTTYATRNLV